MSRKIRNQLIEDARYFHFRGWMMGTAGNLSVRDEAGDFWITASACDKGALGLIDFVRVSCADGAVTARFRRDAKPSAEESIHRAIYSMHPKATACYHVHSVAGNRIAQAAAGGIVELPDIEMLKGFGVKVTSRCVPVLHNHFRVPDIAEDYAQAASSKLFELPLMLIAGHGVTIWAESQRLARNFVELAEYIFEYMNRGGAS